MQQEYQSFALKCSGSLFLFNSSISAKNALSSSSLLLLVLSLTADILEHAQSFQILQITDPERIQLRNIVQWHTKGPLGARTKAKGITKVQ